MNLKVGDFQIKRNSCADHKINVGVRSAIKQSNEISQMLMNLSKFAGISHSSVHLSYLHRINKCKLRRENIMRWNGSNLMLQSFIKAYKAGVFNADYQCPYPLQELEAYCQVLKPVYLFSIYMQHTNSTIGEVLPFLSICLNSLTGFELHGEINNFRNLLIKRLKEKFDFELNSSLYAIAAVFNVASVDCWVASDFGKKLLNNAMTGIEEVYDAYITQSNKILDSSENRKESKDEVENLYYKIAKSNTKQNLNDVTYTTSGYLTNVLTNYTYFYKLITQTRTSCTFQLWVTYTVTYFDYLIISSSVVNTLLALPDTKGYLTRYPI